MRTRSREQEQAKDSGLSPISSGFSSEQVAQQLLGRGGQQFGLAQGLEQGAGTRPAVLVTLIAWQLLQQQ